MTILKALPSHWSNAWLQLSRLVLAGFARGQRSECHNHSDWRWHHHKPPSKLWYVNGYVASRQWKKLLHVVCFRCIPEGKVFWCYICCGGHCTLGCAFSHSGSRRRLEKISHLWEKQVREQERSKPVHWMLGLLLWLFGIVFQRFISIMWLLSFFVAWRVESEK